MAVTSAGGDWWGANAPGGAASSGAPGGDMSEAGKTSEQQYWDAVHGLGWDPNRADQYRGHQDELVNWLAAHGATGWQGGGTKADDWLKSPEGREWDYATSGGKLQFIEDPTNYPGGGGAPGAGGGENAYLNDPSYKFTFDEALKGAQRSAAARGTLMTGGFQKALANYLGGVASQGYNQQFGRLFNVAQLGADTAARQAAQNAAYGNAAAAGQEGVGNAQAAGSVAQGNTWGGLANDAGQLGAYYTLFGPHGGNAAAAGAPPSMGYPQDIYAGMGA